MAMNPRLLRPILSGDPDANRYIAAVQAADQQSLEPAVRKAFTDFVVGAKQDGTWSAIKASCILMGARTLAGALTPLVGSSPTNNNFVSGDYTRGGATPGLVGNATNKFLDTNFNGNTLGQNSISFGVYVSSAASTVSSYIGSGLAATGSSNFGYGQFSQFNVRNRATTSDALTTPGVGATAGFIGSRRSASGSYVLRAGSAETTFTRASETPADATFHVFKTNGSSTHGNGRLAFYWAGDNLDLSLLDTRVSALVTAIGAAIP